MTSRIAQGRQIVKPVKDSYPTVNNVDYIFDKLQRCLPILNESLATKLICSKCNEDLDISDEYGIALDVLPDANFIENCITLKHKRLIKNHSCNHSSGFELKLPENVKVCTFQSSAKMKVNLDQQIQFGGHMWKCSSAIAKTKSVFNEKIHGISVNRKN